MSREVAAFGRAAGFAAGMVSGRLAAGAALMMFAAAPARSQEVDSGAADYIRQAKRNMGLTPREDCGKADSDGAIIVCGRRGENPNRLPLPDEREDLAGKRVRGDIPRATANAPRTYGCSVVGQTNQCTRGLDAMALTGTLIKLLTKIADPEAEVEKPAQIPDKYRGSNK